MCGRYSFPVIDHFFERYSILHPILRLEPHYNVCPGMRLPVVLRQSPRQAVLMRWGLIPSWSRDPKLDFSHLASTDDRVIGVAPRVPTAARGFCTIGGSADMRKIRTPDS